MSQSQRRGINSTSSALTARPEAGLLTMLILKRIETNYKIYKNINLSNSGFNFQSINLQWFFKSGGKQVVGNCHPISILLLSEKFKRESNTTSD